MFRRSKVPSESKQNKKRRKRAFAGLLNKADEQKGKKKSADSRRRLQFKLKFMPDASKQGKNTNEIPDAFDSLDAFDSFPTRSARYKNPDPGVRISANSRQP